MAFIIPNAGNTGGGQTFSDVNQAEPDSLDFEIVGNRSSWVRSGGNATTTSSQVTVQAGVAVIKGVPYSFPSRTVTIPEQANGQYRFDLLVVRRSGTSASVVALTGLASDTNPTLPQSRSTLGSLSYNAAYHVDFDTDVVLYSVLRIGTTALTSSSLVDKRIVDTRPVTYAGSAVPTDSTAGVIGDVLVYNGVGYTYLQDASPRWKSNAPEEKVVEATIPIGTIVCWPGVVAPPEGYLACDGAEYPRTGAYAALYAVLGNKYGGGPSTFAVPNINDERTIYGASISNGSLFGTSGGENSVQLTEAHIPSHKHSFFTNGTDNSHNLHRHQISVAKGGQLSDADKLKLIGGGNRLMCAKDGLGTDDTRLTADNFNNEGRGHTPTMGTWGSGSASVPTKGKHIHLAFYIKAA